MRNGARGTAIARIRHAGPARERASQLHCTTDGANPVAGLIADASGALYGTTTSGGNGYGTVFKLTLPARFAGIPGQANCVGQSVSYLANTYGGISAAAAALGYANVQALRNAVQLSCAG
jgi:uncharacterized repeat protein (TIGR03803 family)